MKLTINEIAEMAGVAKSTVSKALNGQKGVSEETRERILAIASRVKFEPNASARALAQSKSYSIGLVLPHNTGFSLSGAYWSSLITPLAVSAQEKGYTLTIIPAQSTSADNLETILRKKSVDGFILSAEQVDTKNVLSIMSSEIPFVFIGKNPIINHYSVDVNNEEGAYAVTKQLIARGYKNIGCITGPAAYTYTKERLLGFKRAMDEEGLCATNVLQSTYMPVESAAETKQFIEKNANLDALFLAAGGEFVMNILEVLRLAGFDTRRFSSNDARRFGIGVFDDSRIFDFLDWPIIAARQPLSKIGKTVASILFDLIEGKTVETVHHVLDVEIILR